MCQITRTCLATLSCQAWKFYQKDYICLIFYCGRPVPVKFDRPEYMIPVFLFLNVSCQDGLVCPKKGVFVFVFVFF